MRCRLSKQVCERLSALGLARCVCPTVRICASLLWAQTLLSVQELQATVEALQREQAVQHEAISGFTTQLAAVSVNLEACMAATEALTQQRAAANVQLQSMRSIMTEQQTHLSVMASECDRRHETAMKLQQTVATETSLFSQQVNAFSCWLGRLSKLC